MHDVERKGKLSFDWRLMFVRVLFEKWHDLKWTWRRSDVFWGGKEQRGTVAVFAPLACRLPKEPKSRRGKLHSCGVGAAQLAGI